MVVWGVVSSEIEQVIESALPIESWAPVKGELIDRAFGKG
jgi:hypothetical protein